MTEKDGFFLTNARDEQSDFAYLSLDLALRAFAATYKAVIDDDPEHKAVTNIVTGAANNTPDYIRCYASTIIHFHHFFELTVKEVLRSHHIGLADVQDKKIEDNIWTYYHNGSLTQGKKSLEFGRAYKRLFKGIELRAV